MATSKGKAFRLQGLRNRHGKMSVEMILLIAIIALPIIIILVLFRNNITDWFNNQNKAMKDGDNANPGYTQQD